MQNKSNNLLFSTLILILVLVLVLDLNYILLFHLNLFLHSPSSPPTSSSTFAYFDFGFCQ